MFYLVFYLPWEGSITLNGYTVKIKHKKSNTIKGPWHGKGRVRNGFGKLLFRYRFVQFLFEYGTHIVVRVLKLMKKSYYYFLYGVGKAVLNHFFHIHALYSFTISLTMNYYCEYQRNVTQLYVILIPVDAFSE